MNRITEEQKSFVKSSNDVRHNNGLEKEQTVDDARSIPKVETLTKSVCMITRTDSSTVKGTGFLAKIKGKGVCFFGAGHSFKQLIQAVENDQKNWNAELDKYLVHFGNLAGILPTESTTTSPPTKDKPMKLREFLCHFDNFYGSMSYKGRRTVFKKMPNGHNREVFNQENSETDEDYCALCLVDKDINSKLCDLGLSHLQCGETYYLEYNHLGLVTIFGHPGGNATEITSEGLKVRPLRYSFGQEKIDANLSRNRLAFDYDSTGGNSGSPVLGRGQKSHGSTKEQAYLVKGIHVEGCHLNYAQKLTAVQNWIDCGN